MGILCPVLFLLLPNTLLAECITDFRLIDQKEIEYDPEDLEYGCDECYEDDDDDDDDDRNEGVVIVQSSTKPVRYD